MDMVREDARPHADWLRTASFAFKRDAEANVDCMALYEGEKA
jgi:hypothetical protein